MGRDGPLLAAGNGSLRVPLVQGHPMSAIALVVAAGRGNRLGDGVPKQYLDLGGRPVVAHALSAFAGHPDVSAVRAVIHPDDGEHYAAAVAGLRVLDPVPGGASRQQSVLCGLESLESDPPAAVWIHDAARPFVPASAIRETLVALADSPGAIAAVPLADTLKREQDGMSNGTVNREALWRAQTPQAFRYPGILAAHRAAAGLDLTDDAAVAEHAGLAVTLVPGSDDNFKITTAQDLERARRMLDGYLGDVRTGSGFDVHRFGPGDSVTLCGVCIPHSQGLEGRSDADVGLHALTDALLATVSAGDIGVHFPPSDARWNDADSAVFLVFAAEQVRARGGVIGNLDVTLICEKPRVDPHREAMVQRVAELAAISPGRVSVKATTTEGLGFAGRGEGIAAQAIATVRLPNAGSGS
jgi:2-C-methyl-D-erythritol 4-phosphate cytidylyltransferase/2-C-methyl-D-erythritol 2,4-cyclodiphosphate synthase